MTEQKRRLERCRNCRHCAPQQIKGFGLAATYLSCYCLPYKGKACSEIEKCPLMEGKKCRVIK